MKTVTTSLHELEDGDDTVDPEAVVVDVRRCNSSSLLVFVQLDPRQVVRSDVDVRVRCPGCRKRWDVHVRVCHLPPPCSTAAAVHPCPRASSSDGVDGVLRRQRHLEAPAVVSGRCARGVVVCLPVESRRTMRKGEVHLHVGPTWKIPSQSVTQHAT